MENISKNFALQLGALIALYVSLVSLLTVAFGIITLSFPDALTDYWQYENTQSNMRLSIAMLVVFFPTYLVITRMVNTIRRREHGTYLVLTKWLIYLSLLAGGIVLLCDLVVVINTFLNGEITTRFVLKALSVFIVIGAAFYYYTLDARGYWNTHEQQSVLYGLLASIIVFVALVYGFVSIDTPAEVREKRLDQQQIRDLQDIYWRVQDYYSSNTALPESIGELYVGREVPIAPENRPVYAYAVTGEREYELCATFAYDVIAEGRVRPVDLREEPSNAKNILNNSWDYKAGETCFKRVIVDVPTN